MRLTIKDRLVILNALLPKQGADITLLVCKGIEKKIKFGESELKIITQRNKDKKPIFDEEWNPEVEVELSPSEYAVLQKNWDKLNSEEKLNIEWIDTGVVLGMLKIPKD